APGESVDGSPAVRRTLPVERDGAGAAVWRGASAAAAVEATESGEGADTPCGSEKLLDLHEHSSRQRARRHGPARVWPGRRHRPACRVGLKERVLRWR